TLAASLVDTIAPLALNTIMMFFYLFIMIRYSLVMTLVGIISVVFNLFMSQYISKKRINFSRVMMRDSGKLVSTTMNGIAMIETIKSSGAENGYFERWSGYQASLNSSNVKYSRTNTYLGLIPEFVSSLASYAVMFLGIYYAMFGNFTLGIITTFQSYLSSFITPAMSLISAGQTIQETRTEMERVEDVMNYPDDPYFNDTPYSDEIDYAKLKGNVELKHVTFGYSRLAPALIEDFNMKLEPGHSVAFVGASGCGKSTLSKLISGLQVPWAGEILFDGKPIQDIDRSVFTGSLAVVDQDIILFEDTIANNIKMWDNSIEDFEMILAARDASIHEDIMQRENGYQYKLTEGGKDLSGGQRQRLEIARVLAQDPSIIILDEATSALDAKTEYDVVRAIKDRGITCIVVAHRLSTIRDCDEIIVLNKGKVVERGTHEQLYKQGGYYAELISNE
ncbi:MAG: ATP-binding cassette domain-containing protein, partial [Erysipelotrichaceae bacterium]|nr:ATP-binding cassette domain-containing protein [Erysipelotrichaceae bacterium]